MLADAMCARSRLTFEITVERFERGLSLFNSESPPLLVYIYIYIYKFQSYRCV